MPRKPRFYLADIPAHVVQRGNARQAVFYEPQDYSIYLNWLHEGASKYGCHLHAFVLMTNHVHLLLTPMTPESVSLTIQHVGRKYVTYVNRRHKRSGTLWEGRHKSSIISSDEYLLCCMRYIELNPVRAGLVKHPAEYRWSSYHQNASGNFLNNIHPHSTYLSLGKSQSERAIAYKELIQCSLHPNQLLQLRTCLQTGTPLGDQVFRSQIETQIGRQVGQARQGRPAKKVT